ncbi:MAG: hypothetical protein WKF82_05465 [Nocardioidaceae bacterium]
MLPITGGSSRPNIASGVNAGHRRDPQAFLALHQLVVVPGRQRHRGESLLRQALGGVRRGDQRRSLVEFGLSNAVPVITMQMRQHHRIQPRKLTDAQSGVFESPRPQSPP